MKKKFECMFGFIAIAALFVAGCEKENLASEVNVSGQSVEAAHPGDQVSVAGDNFNTVRFVSVGDKQASFELDDDTINFVVPEDAEVGNNKIVLSMEDNSKVQLSFRVLPWLLPRIQEFDAFVPVGGELVITGRKFNPENDPRVTIGGIEAEIVSNTNTELVVIVPDGIPDDEAHEIEITTSYGSTTTKTAFVARENLLMNSQLNEGSGNDFTHWEKLIGGDGMTGKTGAAAYGTGRSMRVVGAGGNPWDTQLASIGVPLTFGAEYTVVIWAKAESVDPSPTISFSVSQWDGNGADYSYSDIIEIGNQWAPYSWTFKVDKDLPTHRVVLDMGRTNVPFMIDHIVLIPGVVAIGNKSDAEAGLHDGGFENGIYPNGNPDHIASWQKNNGIIEITTSEVYCGDQAVIAVGAGNNPWDTQLIADGVVLEEGTQYELSLWAKAAAPDGEISISVSRWKDGYIDDYFYSPTVTVAEEWTNYSWLFTAGSTSTGDHNIVLDLGRSAVTYYIDEVSLKEYPSDNILPDGGFEATTLAGNDVGDWESARGVIALTTSEVYEGSKAIIAVGAGSNPWDTQLIADGVVLEEGKDYRLGLWAKAAAPDGEISISVSRWNENSSDDYFYSSIATVAEDWTYYSWTFTAGTTSTGDHNIVLDLGRNAIIYYIDEVVLSEIPDCE